MKEDKKKVFIKTFGCQMNNRDSEIIKGLLLNKGFQLAEKPETADIILFNTCSVRQHAEDKVWSEIGRIIKLSPLDFAHKERKIKEGGAPISPSTKKRIIGLIGCMAENYKEEAFKKAKGIDLVVGPNNIDAIPLLLKEALREKGEDRQQFLAVGKRERDEFVYKTNFKEEKGHAFVVISEGCDNFCSYCVVPFVRGMLRNRNHESILEEIKRNLAMGINCITLLGQNVNSYCSDTKKFDFVELLTKINSLSGLKELTFVTSHPKDASVKLFKAMAHLEKIKKYLHLPVQSGSDRILKLMNRGYSREHYLNLVDEYRREVPQGKLSTDIIAGFPKETQEDFEATVDLVKKVKFDNAYIFKYSPRPHTQAESLKDDVPRIEKERRHKILLDLQKEISKKKIC